ncbi:MAG: HI0074 family nucleotidyltransferase substrate-binding subunit [Pseudomonadota bacterium]
MLEDFSLIPLKSSLKSLQDILRQPINEYIRDGVIQRFEYTFELSWKTIKRYFNLIGREDIATGPKPILREAGKEKLINDVEEWLVFLDKRNTSTHIYNDEQAQEVYNKCKDFPKYVQELIEELERRATSLN